MGNRKGGKPSYLRVIEEAGANYEATAAALAPDAVETLDPPEIVKARAVALAEWERIGGQLAKLKILSALDYWSLADYCIAVADFVDCENIIQDAGGLDGEGAEYTTSGRNGTQYKPRPIVARRQEALKSLRGAATEFGLTPRARVMMARGPQGDLFGEGAGGPGTVGDRIGKAPGAA